MTRPLDPDVLLVVAAAARVVAHADARVGMLNLRPHLDDLRETLGPVLAAHGRTCLHCGAGFLPAAPHQTHCGDVCREARKTLEKRRRRRRTGR